VRGEGVRVFIYLFIYYTVYTHVKSFTIVKNRKGREGDERGRKGGKGREIGKVGGDCPLLSEILNTPLTVGYT